MTRRRLFVAFAFVAAAAGCVPPDSPPTPIPVPAAALRPTRAEARAIVEKAALADYAHSNPPNLRIEWRRDGYVTHYDYVKDGRTETRCNTVRITGRATQYRRIFYGKDISDLVVLMPGTSVNAVCADGSDRSSLVLDEQWGHATTVEEAQKIAAAWNVLYAAAHPEEDAGAAADFEKRAEAWRAQVPRPRLSDAADRERILAEAAFREKDVDGATEHYENALDLEPLWPDGNYNLALLYAEQKEWRAAAFYMKRYLLLAPDSPDASAAREKVIVWEDKASKEAK